MNKAEFEVLVSKALDGIPAEFKEKLNNVDVVIEDEPSEAQRRKMKLRGDMILLGLYEGIPQTKRTSNYTLVLPDKITIFQKPIENYCRTKKEVMQQVRSTVLHEIGHHFGMSEEELRKIHTKYR